MKHLTQATLDELMEDALVKHPAIHFALYPVGKGPNFEYLVREYNRDSVFIQSHNTKLPDFIETFCIVYELDEDDYPMD